MTTGVPRTRLLAIKMRSHLDRAALGFRFIFGTWSQNDAQKLRWAAQDREGWYPLMGLSQTALLERLADECEDLPENIETIAHSAVSHASEKWTTDGGDYYHAMDDAVERAKAYAAEDGTPLTFKEDYA